MCHKIPLSRVSIFEMDLDELPINISPIENTPINPKVFLKQILKVVNKIIINVNHVSV